MLFCLKSKAHVSISYDLIFQQLTDHVLNMYAKSLICNSSKFSLGGCSHEPGLLGLDVSQAES